MPSLLPLVSSALLGAALLVPVTAAGPTATVPTTTTRQVHLEPCPHAGAVPHATAKRGVGETLSVSVPALPGLNCR